jgi:hypothetical protein
MTIPLIAIPITWTAICIAAFLLWPCERSRGDYCFDLAPLLAGAAAIIGILIGWIGWLLYLVLK